MYYNKNDFRSYLEGDSLTHYGVLGMKWGVHKAKSIDRDIAVNARYNRDRRLKQAYKRGEMDRAAYKLRMKQSKAKHKDELAYIKDKKYSKVEDQFKNITDRNGKKVKSIYEASEKKANALMPHYTRNKRISNALAVAGILGAGAGGFISGTGKGYQAGARALENARNNAIVRSNRTLTSDRLRTVAAQNIRDMYDPSINYYNSVAPGMIRSGNIIGYTGIGTAGASDVIRSRNIRRRRQDRG